MVGWLAVPPLADSLPCRTLRPIVWKELLGCHVGRCCSDPKSGSGISSAGVQMHLATDGEIFQEGIFNFFQLRTETSSQELGQRSFML